MKKSESYRIFAMISLLLFLTANHGLAVAKAGKTAMSYIRVLPYTNKDPFAIEEPPIDLQIQKGFRRSIAELVKQQSLLMELISRDKIRSTDWYKNMGQHTEARNSKALADLKKNFKAVALDDAEFISVSMTCDKPDEAALIVNEAIDLFLDKQKGLRVMQIRNKLAELQDRRSYMESNLTAAEKALDEVRSRFGFTDLEERQYPHPAEIRLNRLYKVKDELLLQIAGVEALAGETEQADQESKELKRKLIVQKAKLAQAEKLLAEAVENKKKLDTARVEYQKRLPIKEGLNNNLNQLKMLIEKHRLLAEDPEAAKVMSVGPAPVPEK